MVASVECQVKDLTRRAVRESGKWISQLCECVIARPGPKYFFSNKHSAASARA